MTDDELIEFLCISDMPRADALKIINSKRATFEKMAEVTQDLQRYEAGAGPLPKGVIVCREHGHSRMSQRRGKL